MSVSVSVKGQLVIPASIRKKYRLEPRTRVEIIDTGEEIVLVPLPKDSFRESRGILCGVSSRDLQIMRRKDRVKEHARKE